MLGTDRHTIVGIAAYGVCEVLVEEISISIAWRDIIYHRLPVTQLL